MSVTEETWIPAFAGMTAPGARSVVFESLHPGGPVLGAGAAGLGPRTGGVELAVPFQGPELLEPDGSDRPVEEEGVHAAVVTIHAEAPHLVDVPADQPLGGLAVVIRRLIDVPGRRAADEAVAEERDGAGAVDVGGPPEPRGLAAADDEVARRVEDPLVEAVAGDVGGRGAPGGKRALPTLGAELRGRRAQAYVGLLVVCSAQVGPRQDLARKVSAAVFGVHGPNQGPLVQIRLTRDASGLLSDALQGGHQNGHQESDNGDDYEQLDEREARGIDNG